MLLWITLFLTVLAPLHAAFYSLSIISILFAFDRDPVRRGITLVLASIYVGLSRWTWVLAPAAIGALIDLLLYYPARQGSFLAAGPANRDTGNCQCDRWAAPIIG